MLQKTRRSRTFGFALLLAFSMLTSPALQSTAHANPKSTQRLTVTFNADSSVLDSRAKKSLKSFYRDHKNDKTLSVTGYVQRSDISSNNRSLSLRRAKAVRNYFKTLGFKGAITVHAGKVPSHNPWSARSRKSVVTVVESGQQTQPTALAITIKADAVTARYAELTANYIWKNGGYWHQVIDKASYVVQLDLSQNSIQFSTTGGMDYQIKVNNQTACPLVVQGMSASFNCSNIKNGDTINITHDAVSTVRVKMSDSAVSMGQQVASYYTGPSGSTYQDGMTTQQDIAVATGAHDFNIVIYYTTTDFFVVYRNDSQQCTFDGSTSSTYTCANVEAGDVINVYASHCLSNTLRVRQGSGTQALDPKRMCIR